MENSDARIQYPVDARHAQRPRELAMSAAWHGGLARRFETTDGLHVNVVFHGHWSHGFGPDFSDAMIVFDDAALLTGAVEIHTKSSDWYAHGHHLDARYDAVVLHVVSIADVPETRRADGKIVPVAILNVPDPVLFAIDQRLPDIWAEIGGSVCAEDLARRHPDKIRNAILRLGDVRLNDRVGRYESELVHEPASDVMLRALFDAFGYSENRAPMTDLADVLIRHGLSDRVRTRSGGDRFDYAAALLLGLGGFLPMSPSDAHLAGLDPDRIGTIEARWRIISPELGETPIAATRWTRARTRPANHPVTRLVTATTLLDATVGDPFTVLIETIRSETDLPRTLRSLCAGDIRPSLGRARAIAIASSVILPIALAYGRHIGDTELEDAASRMWARLPPSEWSRPARRALTQAAGSAPVRMLGERGLQGLLHLDRNLCTPRRCHACPVAAEVVRDRQRDLASG